MWIRSISSAAKIGSVDPAQLEAFGLDPDVLHLNHGAFGVAPVVVRRAAAAWRERAERNPHRFNRVEEMSRRDVENPRAPSSSE
jgi:hypothetical protein